MDITCCRI